MTLTYKSLSKNQKTAFYTGAATVLRFLLSAFPSQMAPQTIDVPDGTFAPPKAAKVPGVKLTAEERKAARLAKPKPTLAEKIAKREAELAKLRLAAANDAHASM